MLINLRNALMASKRLPYDAELEYLESTGTQWIDSGYSFNSATDKVELVFELLTTTPNYKWIFGAYDTSKRFAIGSGDNADRRTFGYNASTSYNSSTYYTNGAHIFLADSTGASIDGHSFFGFADFSTTSHIILYSIPIDTSTFCSNSRIWSYKHYRNGVLVRDYIPVRKGTVGYLYDRVSGKLFGNAGTGDFVLGQDVVPVEWLEGGQLDSGIAFIDTGYTPNSSTKVESTAAILSANGYSGRYGNQSRFTFGAISGKLYLAQGKHYYLEGYTAGTFYSFVNDIPNRTVSVEGVGSTSTVAVSYWYPQAYPVYLFASNVSPTGGTNVNGKTLDPNSLGQIRMKSCSIWENDIPVLNYRPVRVGTDATSWEGAMMDVFTRRIYRNAGTGAFTYGNDLKYPIPAS